MKHLLGLLVVLSINTVSANEHSVGILAEKNVSFSYNSRHSAYACSYLERQAEAILTKMGVEEMEIKCRGGLPWLSTLWANIDFMAVSLVSQGTAISPVKTTNKTVKFHFRESCDFNEKLMKKILEQFEVTKIKKQGACWDSSGSLRYTIDFVATK